MSVIDVRIVKKGEADIPGITDKSEPRRLGPKRVGRIRKLFNLDRSIDVRPFVVKRQLEPKEEGKKPTVKAPKIQRLVTPTVLQRKRHRKALKRKAYTKAKDEEAQYKKMLAQIAKEKMAAKSERKRRQSSLRKSQSEA